MQTMSLSEIVRDSGLQPPRELTLAITPRCNLLCAHCWPEAGPVHAGAQVDLTAIQYTLEQWVAAGLENICLTGGEPLTHPQWREIVRYCCDVPGLTSVRLQTNATLLTPEAVRFFNTPGFGCLNFQVSLDGAEPAAHDRVRGVGSFDKALRGLHWLAQAGLGSRTVVAFTEMAHNFDQLPRLLALLDAMGIGRLVSGTLVRSGRAADGSGLELPTAEQYRNLIRQYHDDAQFRNHYEKMGNIACLEWLAGRMAPAAAECCNCMQTPYLTAEGKLYPCVLMPLEKYAVKGAWLRSFESVLKEAVALWAELPVMSRRRLDAIAQCAVCPGRAHCGGGCLGRSVASTGDFLAVEDRCALRRTVYAWPEPF